MGKERKGSRKDRERNEMREDRKGMGKERNEKRKEWQKTGKRKKGNK